MDNSRFLSKRGLLKRPSPIREILPLASLPGMISLGGGLPNKNTFPFQSLTVELKNNEKIIIDGADLELGLQYSPTYGLPVLSQWLKDLQTLKHSLPSPQTKGREWNLLITTGSQEALSMAAEVLLDDGDSIICEEPTYSGTLSILRPMSLNLIGIETDSLGMIPSKLEERLENLPSGIKKPKVIYLIPTGQNPAGSTMNDQRKKEIYRICQKYDLLILEDDPYYYLQYNESGPCEYLGQSFLSMDTEQRVLRFDSLSKILSSGIRIGFLTGNHFLVEKVQLHQQASTLHASGLSQIVTQKLLTHWGIEKWDQHIKQVQIFYMEKRNQFLKAIETHLKDLVEYSIPSAGMFFWLKVKNVTDTKALISEKAIEKKVLLLPGDAFTTINSPSSYVRASFSTATEEQMNEALKRFSEILKEIK